MKAVLRSRDTASFLWLALIMSIAGTLAILLPVTPNDYWWYLRLGGDILETGAIPTVDTFTYSQLGTPVVYHSWASAIIFFLVYQLGGLSLTVLLRTLIILISGLLVLFACRRINQGRLGTALVLFLWILATSNNWSMRPQLFAYPLFALSLYLLYRWREGCTKCVYWLPLISLVWVNVHGSFVMLVLLAGAALIFSPDNQGASRKALLLSFLGVMLATLLNPRGLGAWTYIFTSITVPSSQLFSVEWLPPVNDHWQINIFFVWLLLFPVLAATSPHKLSRFEWAWFILFGFMALWGERYIVWFIFVLAILTTGLLSPWEKKYIGDPKPGSPVINGILAGLLLLLPLLLLPGIREKWWLEAPDVTENTPITATQWLADHPEFPGPLWSEIGFSSYLEFHLPERPTWIDTRFEVFPVEQWQAYRDITEARYNWQDNLDESGATLLMVSKLNQSRLITALEETSTWCDIYADDVTVIYQQCGGGD